MADTTKKPLDNEAVFKLADRIKHATGKLPVDLAMPTVGNPRPDPAKFLPTYEKVLEDAEELVVLCRKLVNKLREGA